MAEAPVVLFLSLLKPCDDVRTVLRLAPSVQKTLPNAKILSIGPYATSDHTHDVIQYIGLFPFKRGGVYRLKHLIQLLKKSFQVKPQVVIINIPDLLIVAIANKILFGSKIVYDVQENYALNAGNGAHHTTVLGMLKSWIIRSIEYICCPWADRFWLAEEVYVKQLPWLKNKYRSLLNLPLNIASPAYIGKEHRQFKAVLTGTISIAFGAYKALEWINILHIQYPDARFLIRGHCPDRVLHDHLNTYAENKPWLELDLFVSPLAHQVIINTIQSSEILLCPYEDRSEVRGKIPSKILEALALGIPVVYSDFLSESMGGSPFELLPKAYIATELPKTILYKMACWEHDIEVEMRLLGYSK